eukprot:scaffold654739_cov66-Prasinocladus_malaysianus.AAC.1
MTIGGKDSQQWQSDIILALQSIRINGTTENITEPISSSTSAIGPAVDAYHDDGGNKSGANPTSTASSG